ncbi:MAG TPA: substrate-binding domain-containing protein [Candidatus Pygmaiobacter gallistercoris]|nr:substrate-binding domain-containing protein [Candidatus Pygmaiobacter gallistercoris]
MKKVLALVLALALAFSAVGCSGGSSSGSTSTGGSSAGGTSAGGDEKFTIGLILPNVENSAYVAVMEQFKANCEEQGYEFMFQTAADDAAAVTAIESMVQAGCDAICSSASSARNDAFQAAVDAGVLMCGFDGECESAWRNYIGKNYEQGYNTGSMCGKWITEKYGDEPVKVALLTYTKTEFLVPRDEGMRDGIADFAPNAQIVNTAEETTVPGCVTAVEAMLQADPDLVAICGFAGFCGLGAYEVFKAQGLNDGMHGIFSTDGTIEEFNAIKESNGDCYISCTDTGFTTLGTLMSDGIIAKLKGEDDGQGDTVYWPISTVTIDNVDEAIASVS